jgi:hypothetical protein
MSKEKTTTNKLLSMEQFKWQAKLRQDFIDNEKLKLAELIFNKNTKNRTCAVPWATSIKGKLPNDEIAFSSGYITEALVFNHGCAYKSNRWIISLYADCITALIEQLELIGMSLAEQMIPINYVADLILKYASYLVPYVDIIVNRGYLNCKYLIDLVLSCHLSYKCDSCGVSDDKWTGDRYTCPQEDCNFDLCHWCCANGLFNNHNSKCSNYTEAAMWSVPIPTLESICNKSYLTN